MGMGFLRSVPYFGVVTNPVPPRRQYEMLSRHPQFSSKLAEDVYMSRYRKKTYKLFSNDREETIAEIDAWAYEQHELQKEPADKACP